MNDDMEILKRALINAEMDQGVGAVTRLVDGGANGYDSHPRITGHLQQGDALYCDAQESMSRLHTTADRRSSLMFAASGGMIPPETQPSRAQEESKY